MSRLSILSVERQRSESRRSRALTVDYRAGIDYDTFGSMIGVPVIYDLSYKSPRKEMPIDYRFR